MKKEEILAKSRKENKNRDLFKSDVEQKSGQISSVTLVLLATVLFVIQHLIGGGFNFALYALIICYGAVDFFIKYVYIKKIKYLLLSMSYFLVMVILIVLHLNQFVLSR